MENTSKISKFNLFSHDSILNTVSSPLFSNSTSDECAENADDEGKLTTEMFRKIKEIEYFKFFLIK